MSDVPGFVAALTNDMEGQVTKLYDYQIEHMYNRYRFRHIDKARQVGMSYAFAGEAVAKNYLKNLQTSIFISYQHEEAMEKIRFAKAFHESIPTEYQKTLHVDNKQSLEFLHNGKITRILSFANRQPRGKGHNTDIYLDEFAHMNWAEEIYVAALPAMMRGTGTLTAASTPLGKASKHYKISEDKEKYPEFSRQKIHWWECPILCVNVDEARIAAPGMSTEERVARFGTEIFKPQFRNTDLESFQQEFELYHCDSSLSYFSLELIKTCTFDYDNNNLLEPNIDPEEAPLGFSPIKTEGGLYVPDTIMNYYAGEKVDWYYNSARIAGGGDANFEEIKDVVDRLIMAMQLFGFGRTLLLGMDIGRKANTSEICIMEQIDIKEHNLHVDRLSIEMDDVPFKLQEKILRYVLTQLPIVSARIDKTGIGYNLAENTEDDFPRVVEGIEFNIENKGDMAKNLRFRFEDRTIAIYNDPNIIKHIHSIKRNITEASRVKYESDEKKKHHGDKFWARALASIAGDSYDRSDIISSIVKVSGQRRFQGGENGFPLISTPNDSILDHIVSQSNDLFVGSKYGGMAGEFFDARYIEL